VVEAVTVLLFVAFATAAIVLFVRGARLRAASYVTPLLDARQSNPVAFDAPGVYVLYHEVLQGMHLFSKWRYLLWDGANNAYIESRWAQSRKVSGQYAQRWRVRYFDVPHAGDYQLVTEGLAQGDEVKVIVGRYVLAPAACDSAAVLCVIAAAFSGMAFFILRG
jgi:hypothetical protein